jgi:oligopeptide/dipeptide ABC transporter ATP-binding protein
VEPADVAVTHVGTPDQAIDALLEVRGLSVTFQGRQQDLEAVTDVSFEVGSGETVAIVGESGSGKSVTARSVLGLLPDYSRTRGSVRLRGRGDLRTMSERALRGVRGAEIAMIFQDPMTSLDPLYPVGKQIAEALRTHRSMSRQQARARAVELLREVGIPDPHRRVDAYPHELSGGQQQRVMIAIALSCEPALLIADEPTTALDVTVEAQILRMIRDLQAARGMSLLLITHDMGVVAEMADRVVVMYAGRVVEQGSVRQVLKDPQHPYTTALLRSIPQPSTGRGAVIPHLAGAVPPLSAMPSGCRFHPRCERAWALCADTEPTLFDLGSRSSRCWLHDVTASPAPARPRTPEPSHVDGDRVR